MKEDLTTEKLRKKFKNNFNLCNFSINVGRNLILNGEQVGLSNVLDAVDKKIDAEKN